MVGVSGNIISHGNGFHIDRTKSIWMTPVTHTDQPTIAKGAFGGWDTDAAADYNFANIIVPEDMSAFLKVKIAVIAQGVAEYKNTFAADYGLNTEVYSAEHEDKADVVLVASPTADRIYVCDTTLVLANLVVGDILGISQAIDTGDVVTLGFIFEYTADQ